MFPDSLNVLVPSEIAAIPPDVVDGKPLRYVKTDSGYRLWSVGWEDSDSAEGFRLDSGADKSEDWVWQIRLADEVSQTH
jgi:hypothetical protein